MQPQPSRARALQAGIARTTAHGRRSVCATPHPHVSRKFLGNALRRYGEGGRPPLTKDASARQTCNACCSCLPRGTPRPLPATVLPPRPSQGCPNELLGTRARSGTASRVTREAPILTARTGPAAGDRGTASERAPCIRATGSSGGSPCGSAGTERKMKRFPFQSEKPGVGAAVISEGGVRNFAR
ncbi:hypothetical protein BV20DRAFT_266662 [Pilatotrama ljubarskyi]|nr:hypothetical protein BV20DRAFT_266662 [Pilatotrama ljubarskyi]